MFGVQSLSCVVLFVIPWTAARQASLFFIISWSLLKLMPTESMKPLKHLILCHPLLLPSSFPASGTFQMSRLFEIGTSVSASVLPMNIQGLFPLVLTGLISLQFRGLSRVFSSITALSLLSDLALTSVHDCWKNHSFDFIGLY